MCYIFIICNMNFQNIYCVFGIIILKCVLFFNDRERERGEREREREMEEGG